MSDSEEPKKSNRVSSAPTRDDTLKSHMIINLNSNMLIMSQMVGEMASAVKDVAVKISDVEARRKRDRLVFGVVVFVLILAVASAWSNITSNERQINNQDEQLTLLKEQLKILKDATSPEAQARNAEATARAVNNIVCQNNASLIAFAEANDLLPPPQNPGCTGN